MKKLYDWTMDKARSRRATTWLGVISFLESSIFPIPPDIMLLPMCLAQRDRAFFLAFVATVTSVLGGVAGYVIGYFFFESFGQWIIELYHLQDKFEIISARFHTIGAESVLIAGVTPIPFKLVTITSGFVKLSLMTFILASIVARSLRFFLLAALVWKFGEPVRAFIEQRLQLVISVVVVAVIGGFVVVKYLV